LIVSLLGHAMIRTPLLLFGTSFELGVGTDTGFEVPAEAGLGTVSGVEVELSGSAGAVPRKFWPRT
jgi:hypothetical protein